MLIFAVPGIDIFIGLARFACLCSICSLAAVSEDNPLKCVSYFRIHCHQETANPGRRLGRMAHFMSLQSYFFSLNAPGKVVVFEFIYFIRNINSSHFHP